MGSFLLNGRATLLFLVFLGTEVWAEHPRKNCKSDTTSCLSWLWVCFFFQRTDGSVIFQWPRMDRELFWLLTMGWILGLFTPFCTEACGSREECPGKTHHFRWVKEAQEEKKEWTQWVITDLTSYASSLNNAWPCSVSHAPRKDFHFQSLPS